MAINSKSWSLIYFLKLINNTTIKGHFIYKQLEEYLCIKCSKTIYFQKFLMKYLKDKIKFNKSKKFGLLPCKKNLI